MSTSQDPHGEEEFLQQLYKGGELLAVGKVVEAKTHLEKANLIHPKNEKAQNLLGLAYFKLGVFDQAAKIYEALVVENPSDPTLRVNLGLVYLKTNALERSIGEFRTATDLQPDHKKAHNYLGLALAQAGDYSKARQHFVLAGSDAMAEKMARAIANGAQTAPVTVSLSPPPSAPPPPAKAAAAAPAAVVEPAPVAAVVTPTDERQIEVMSDEGAHPEAESVSVAAKSPPSAPAPKLTPVPAASDLNDDWGAQLGGDFPGESIPRAVEGRFDVSPSRPDPIAETSTPVVEEMPVLDAQVAPEEVLVTEMVAASVVAPPSKNNPIEVKTRPEVVVPKQFRGDAAVTEKGTSPSFEVSAPSARDGSDVAPGSAPENTSSPTVEVDWAQVNDTATPAQWQAEMAKAESAAPNVESGPNGQDREWVVPSQTVRGWDHAPSDAMGAAFAGEVGVAATDREGQPAEQAPAPAPVEQLDQGHAAQASHPVEYAHAAESDPSANDAHAAEATQQPADYAQPTDQSYEAPADQQAQEAQPGGYGEAGQQGWEAPAQPAMQVTAEDPMWSQGAPQHSHADAQQDVPAPDVTPSWDSHSMSADGATQEIQAALGATHVDIDVVPEDPHSAQTRPGVVAVERYEAAAAEPGSTIDPGFQQMHVPKLNELGPSLDWNKADMAGPFHVGADGLALKVDGELFARLTGLVAVVGGVEVTPEMKRARGRATEWPFGEADQQLQRCKGHGVVYLDAGNANFQALELDEDGAYIREENVFAFEESVAFENGRLTTDDNLWLDLVHLKGQGRVMMKLYGQLKAMAIPGGRPLMVPLARVVGWYGSVTPRLVSFGGQAAIELVGDGYALLATA